MYRASNKFKHDSKGGIQKWSGGEKYAFKLPSVCELHLHILADKRLEEVEEGIAVELLLGSGGSVVERKGFIHFVSRGGSAGRGSGGFLVDFPPTG